LNKRNAPPTAQNQAVCFSIRKSVGLKPRIDRRKQNEFKNQTELILFGNAG
jgi:hypothetical protein